jgi:hypothetical protein
MQRVAQAGTLGALLLGSALLGYAFYELVLWPGAGFPTRDVEVILAGAPTLRIGHLLKFADALALALLAVTAHGRLRAVAPVTAQLAVIAAVVAATLFLASGMLGLQILSVATEVYPLDPNEAITTIYLRTVTQALFDAAATAAGCFGLFFSLGGLLSRRLPRALAIAGIAFGGLFAANRLLTDELILVAVVLAMLWSFWLAIALWRDPIGS